MNKFTNPLDNIKIASPCSQDWNAMLGNDRKRFCGECKLNVYNLSNMSKEAAERLLGDSEGRLCVRFFRRADGTILTKDCPVGWARVKQGVARTATAFASLFFGLLTGLGLMSLFERVEKNSVMGAVTYKPAPETQYVMGAMNNSAPKQPIYSMGNVAIMGDAIPISKKDMNRKSGKN